MRKIIIIAALAAFAFVCFGEIITPTQRAALNRRRAVSRERIEIGGTNYWVVTYNRGGLFDGCVTNAERVITGAIQNNPIQYALEKREAAIAKVRARAVEKAAYYRQLESKAVTQTMKKLYAEIAELNEKIIEELDGE